MTQIIRLSRFFLLTSIATTFIKIPSLYQYYRIADLFLFISFIFIIIAIIKKQILLWEDKKLILILLLIISVNIFGSILSFLIFKGLPLQIVILNYARLASCLIIFFEIILLSQQDKLLFKKSILCLLGSLIIIPLAFILQKLGYDQYLMFDPTRFSGLLIDPNYFANFQIIPTLLLLFYIMRDNIQIKYRAILYIGFVFSILTILWSGSRSGIIGLLVSILILLFLFIKFSKVSKTKIATILLLIILAFPLGFILIPKYKQITIDRNEQITTGSEINEQITTGSEIIDKPSIPLKTKIEQKTRIETFSKISSMIAGNDRIMIWRDSIYFILRNPFGYGPGYDQIINIRGDGGEHRVVHNFELEILLQGGILLFIFFNYFFIKLLIKIYKSSYFKNFNEIHALVAIIIGILISALFLDSIPQKWIWIIFALMISYNTFSKTNSSNNL